jgi:hypothetical protein
MILKDKVALVTGGTAGIGRATAIPNRTPSSPSEFDKYLSDSGRSQALELNTIQNLVEIEATAALQELSAYGVGEIPPMGEAAIATSQFNVYSSSSIYGW